MSSNTIINWRPENVIRHLPWKLDSKTALGVLLILATFSLVGWLYLTQASAVTTTSYRIDELRIELDQIKNQNATLSLEIAQLEALSYVEKRAGELGFGPTGNVRYLAVANYPIAPVKELATYDPVRVAYDRQSPTTNKLGGSAWWLEKLDDVAAWLVEE